jgi:hypothetical protein
MCFLTRQGWKWNSSKLILNRRPFPNFCPQGCSRKMKTFKIECSRRSKAKRPWVSRLRWRVVSAPIISMCSGQCLSRKPKTIKWNTGLLKALNWLWHQPKSN